ncbi:MAG: PAS domain-containing protein [Chlorobi bacterium]|nr:PAS domain-containing protein [Chlorobiota bacterium]
MKYKHFYFAILRRIFLLIALSSVATYLFVTKVYVWGFITIAPLVLGIFNVIGYFNKTNKWISFFLLGIENEDSTLKIPGKSGNKSIDEVYEGIKRLNDVFKQTKIDISTQEHYYRSVINQSATGLFSINESGRVININPAAVKLTGLQEYHHVNILSNINSALPGFIVQSERNDNNSLVFENRHGQKLLFKLSCIKTSKGNISLVAVSDITKELDNREVDAWIKLARTLSHEIMNNIAPITTLSKVISGYFIKKGTIIKEEDVDSVIIKNTVKGLKVIEEQSSGLMNFVENYRKFTKLPDPEFSVIDLSAIIENTLLAAAAFKGFGSFKITRKIAGNIFVSADEKLLSQVIINLLKNACEALVAADIENPELIVGLSSDASVTRLGITNNGPGIPPEIREQIFVPFYTTKENGSGVGLSLSKQIMLKMGGDVILDSRKDTTTFTVVLELNNSM